MDAAALPFTALGPEWDGLFDAGPGFQSTRAWFAALIEAGLPPGAGTVFLAARDDAGPAALLPLLIGPGGTARGLATVYTCLYQPLLRPGLLDVAGAAAAMARVGRVWPVVTLDALDPAWPHWPAFLAGLRVGGWWSEPFAHFGNWSEPVAGRSFDAYMAARPGPLRETVRRKTRLCAREPGLRIEVVTGGRRLDAAIAGYEDVYARSWKPAEAAPGLTAALLPRAAASGVLRMGVMWAGDLAIAAQYWTVTRVTATVLKLAHDDAWRRLSPGTVLTAHMIRLSLEAGVSELDFGRGDDEYKSSWTTVRRPRVGYVLVNRFHPKGLWAWGRQRAGRLLRSANAGI